MSLCIGRTRLRVHPLLLLMPLLARKLGAGDALIPLGVGLAVHESAHLAAARLFHVRVSGVSLMPFGGAMDIDNPYALSPGQLFAVACAGPIGSLCAVVLPAALAHWRWLSPVSALAFARINLALMLFNLIPALPLDGGRMLYALLFGRLGRERAAQIGIRAGRLTAALLILGAIAFGIHRKRLNLSPLFAAVFILAAAKHEREALSEFGVRTLLSVIRPAGRPLAARLYAVSEDCAARRALRVAQPDAPALYAVYGDDRLKSLTDDRSLLEALLRLGDDARVRQAWQRPAS